MLVTRQQKLVALSAGFLSLALVVTSQAALSQVYIPVPPRRSYYGAFTLSRAEGFIGTAENFSSRREAEKSSLVACSRDGVKGCSVVAWFRNSCGAFATDSRRIFGFSFDRDPRVAQVDSVEECRKAGGTDCEVREIICSTGR